MKTLKLRLEGLSVDTFETARLARDGFAAMYAGATNACPTYKTCGNPPMEARDAVTLACCV
jgi:hypothetical protein